MLSISTHFGRCTIIITLNIFNILFHLHALCLKFRVVNFDIVFWVWTCIPSVFQNIHPYNIQIFNFFLFPLIGIVHFKTFWRTHNLPTFLCSKFKVVSFGIVSWMWFFVLSFLWDAHIDNTQIFHFQLSPFVVIVIHFGAYLRTPITIILLFSPLCCFRKFRVVNMLKVKTIESHFGLLFMTSFLTFLMIWQWGLKFQDFDMNMH